MLENIIFLDLDGVLINPFPASRPDEMDEDGYAKFNETATNNLKLLLKSNPQLKIVISSSRRVRKSIERLEEIFAYRGIQGKIIDKIPDPTEIYLSRVEEVSHYIEKHKVKNFLIIDDDRTLLRIDEKYANRLILTKYRDGFTAACLAKAELIIDTIFQ